MLSLYPTWNRWLSTVPDAPAISSSEPYDLPNEIWSQIFENLSSRDLYAAFTSCHHFNDLALRTYLSKPGISLNMEAGDLVTQNSDMLPILSLAVHLPHIARITCAFDIRKKPARAPRDLRALKLLIARIPPVVYMRLSFAGDLLSAYKSDLVPHKPQRIITENFCDLLSSLSLGPDAPIVFVGTEVLTSLPIDIKSWQLDKYRFTDPGEPIGGLFGLFDALLGTPTSTMHSPQTQTTVRMHNGRLASVFPFLSISSVYIVHPSTPLSREFLSWTLVMLNKDSPHWPNLLSLSAPLSAEEWAAILPLLNFPNLPSIRMDPFQEFPSIPVSVLDAFLCRHAKIARLYYYPDPLTIPEAGPLPRTALPLLRNLTTTARCIPHLLISAEVFPKLHTVRITGPDYTQITEALRLLSLHAGSNRLILEVSTGSWMFMTPADADIVRQLDHVETVVLFGFTDFVEPTAIVEWIKLFPALRRVGLRGCLHDDIEEERQSSFLLWAREELSRSVELIST